MIDAIRRQLDDLLDFLRTRSAGKASGINVEALEPRMVPATAQVAVINVPGGGQTNVTPFGPAYTSGVTVALGDFTGDGVPDTVVGPGAGSGVRQAAVFDGVTNALVRSFSTSVSSAGGVSVAAADFNRDGTADVVLGAGQSIFSEVEVRDGLTGGPINFFSNTLGVSGVNVAAGDVNGDGTPDLIVGSVLGGSPRVNVYDGTTLANFSFPTLIAEVIPFDPALRTGVHVAAGDVNGDLRADLIFGSGQGNGPRIRVADGAKVLSSYLSSGGQPVVLDTQPGLALADFFAANPAERLGANVAAADLNGDSTADIVTGTSGTVRAFDGKTFTQFFTAQPFPGRTNLLAVGASPGTPTGRIAAGPVPVPPTAQTVTAPPVRTVAGQPTTVQFTADDPDQSPDTLQYSAVAGDPTLLPGSALTFGGSGTNRTLTITPPAGRFGTTSVTVTVTDADGLTATLSYTVSVNSPPAPLNVGDVVNVFTDVSTNPYASGTGTPSLSVIDPATGAEEQLFALAGLPTGGVAVLDGDVFFATSASGSGATNPYSPVDDTSTVFRFDSDTGTLTTVATFGRESGGLAVAPDGSLLNVFFDGVYGTNPYGPESATIGLSRIDPATGAETVLFTQPVAGLPLGQFSPPPLKPNGVAAADGAFFITLSDPGNGSTNPYSVSVDDDNSALMRFDPATGQASTLATFNRESRGLSAGADGHLLNVFFDGVYGTNPYGPESATIGLSRIDPATGAETVLTTEAVPGLPFNPTGFSAFSNVPPLPKSDGVTELPDGRIVYAVTSPTRKDNRFFQGIANTTDLRVFDPATGTLSTLATYRRQSLGLASVQANAQANRAPVAAPDSGFTTPVGKAITVPAPGVLGNDTDPDGDPLTAVLEAAPPPSQGTVSLNPYGDFTFTPAPGFVGTASFTYRASDGKLTSPPATVTITVVNRPPVANPDSGFSIPAGKLLTVPAPGVLGNDADPDGDAITAVIETRPPSSQGTVTLNPDGSFTFRPASGFVGATSFTYRASDGKLTSPPATVSVTVLDAPAAIGGQVFLDANKNGKRDTVGAAAPSVALAPPGPVALARNDDDSTSALDFGFTFNFFGKDYTQFFLNNNGNVTLTAPLEQFTPVGFPQSLPIVAPFWADVDTRPAGSAEVRLARGTSSRDNPFVQIDWPGVGYFDRHADRLDDFSLYIEDDPGGDIVAFVYRGMQWTTGDVSGGSGGFGGGGAQVGFDPGTGTNFVSLGRPNSDSTLTPFRDTQFVFRIDPSGVPRLFAEPGLDGRTVELVGADGAVVAGQTTRSIDLNGDGKIDPVTEQGLYRFENVAPGAYTARLVPGAGFAQSLPADGAGYALRVAAGDDSPGNLFGAFPAAVRLYAVGAGAGGGPRVRVFDAADDTLRFDLFAFEPTFSGGVRVAVGDVTGDGIDDVVVAAGPGGGPRVAVFDGATGDRVADFWGIDDPDFRGGVHVAVGDVTGDGRADIVAGAGSGGAPRVAVFDGTSLANGAFTRKPFGDFFAFDPGQVGGVRVAAGDLDGDGRAEVVAAGGPSGDTDVLVFDGRTGAKAAGFQAFAPGYRAGLFVGVIGAAPGGTGAVVVSKDSFPDYEGSVFSNLVPNLPPEAVVSEPVARVFEFGSGLSGPPVQRTELSPYAPTFLEGVRVSGGTGSSATGFNLLTGPGQGGGSLVRAFRYDGGAATAVREFNAFEPDFLGGVYVGAS